MSERNKQPRTTKYTHTHTHTHTQTQPIPVNIPPCLPCRETQNTFVISQPERNERTSWLVTLEDKPLQTANQKTKQQIHHPPAKKYISHHTAAQSKWRIENDTHNHKNHTHTYTHH